MQEVSTKMCILGSGKLYIAPNSTIRGFYADMSFLEVDERLSALSITPRCSDFGSHAYRFIVSPNAKAMLGFHVPYGGYLPGSLTLALGYMAANTRDLLERIELRDIIVLGMRLNYKDIKLVPRITFVDKAATKVRLELVESTVEHLQNSLLFYTAPCN